MKVSRSAFSLGAMFLVSAFASFTLPGRATASDDAAPTGQFEHDAIECPPDRPVGLYVRPNRDPETALERYAELDLMRRQGCATTHALRQWQELHERLAPFTVEPNPDWRVNALDQSRRMPLVRPAAFERTKTSLAATSDWNSLGPTNQGGRLRGLVLDPRDENTIYVAAATGGVWKTTDAGGTWQALTDAADTLNFSSLVIDPSAPDTLYAGTGESFPGLSTDAHVGIGIFKSTNAGANWSRAGVIASKPVAVYQMAILPSTPQGVFAATDKGIYRSTDAGGTWSRAIDGVASDVVVEAGSTSIVWAAIGKVTGDSKNGVYRSTDGGAHFTKMAGGVPSGCGRIELGISPSPETSKTIYLGCSDPGNFTSLGVWKTTDGSTWTQLATAPQYCGSEVPQCWWNNIIAVNPLDANKVFLGGLDVYVSTNGGTSFSKKTDWRQPDGAVNLVHADQHAAAISPTGVTWIACDGGLYRSTDGGTTWADRSSGLVTAQFYGMAQSATAAAPLIGGLQDNGTQRTTGDIGGWKEGLGGDGGYCAIDPITTSVMWAEYYYLNLHKSTNGGSSFGATATNGIPQDEINNRTLFISPFTGDPVRANRLLAGTNKVYLTTNGATLWQASSGDITESTSSSVSAVAFSVSDPNVAWAGTDNGKVWMTSALGPGATWTNVGKPPLPSRYVKRIAVDPVDPKIAYVAYSGTGGGHIYRTIDSGTTWTDISGNLPDAPTSGIAIDPANTNRIWVGNDIGVYYSENLGASWARYGAGFPNVRVDEILFQSTLRLIRAATHGRGMWEASADLVIVAPPAAAFAFSPTVPVAGTPVTFTDSSTGSPSAWAWNFGDGSSSTEASPTHTYTAAGTFTVKLTVTNSGGSSNVSKTVVVSPAAATYVPALVVPGQARTEGSGGSFFKTSLWMTNPGSAESKVRLEYLAATGGSNGGGVATKDVTVAVGKSVSYADVLSEAFGATTGTSGVIIVHVLSGTPAPLVTSRTFNDAGAAGTFGQYIPAVNISSAAPAGDLRIHGLGGDGASRSNVGIVNFGDTAATATLSVIDPTGQKVGTDVIVSIDPRTATQKNRINELAGVPNLTFFSVAATSTSPIFVYASKLDNLTSDPIFVPGTLAPRSTKWIDATASASGAGSTFFRSNLSLTNTSSASATVTLQFTKRTETAAGAIFAVTLAPGEEKFYTDAVSELFGLSGVAGTISLATGASTPVVAWARTYNDKGAGNGTFGQFIPAFGTDDLIGSKGAILQGLSQSASDASGFRTNMGFFNASAASVAVTVSAWNPDGSQAGSKIYTVLPSQAIFQQRIINDIAPGVTVTNGYVKVVPSAQGAIYAWASSVDNVSTDQIFVRPIAIP